MAHGLILPCGGTLSQTSRLEKNDSKQVGLGRPDEQDVIFLQE